MSDTDQLVQDLKDITAQVAKIGTESSKTLQMVTDLEAQIATLETGAVPQEVKDAVTALKTQVQLVDDLVPDAAATPPTGDTGTPPSGDPTTTPPDQAPSEDPNPTSDPAAVNRATPLATHPS